MTYLIIGLIVIFDQWIKLLVRDNFVVSESISVIRNIFHLTYVQNKGAAFGILAGHTEFFIIISFLIIGGVLIYRYRAKKNFWLDVAVGLIIGGAVGNIMDRLFLGYVVDYLDFRIWPVFNLADSAVVIGMGILIIYLWKLEEASN